MRHSRFLLGSALSLFLLISGGLQAQPLTAVLLGANEFPGPGDPDGTGLAVITIDSETGTVRYTISVQNISAPVAAHIHTGPAGVEGGILVDLLPTFMNNLATGMVTGLDAEDLENILANPSNFYVNVHTADFAAGAVRGQLRADASDSTQLTFPILATVPGAAGTNFRSDMRLVNNSGESVEVLLHFFMGGGSANSGPTQTATITLEPGEQALLDDVLQDQFGVDIGSGAVQLFSSRPIVAVARIYNDQRASDRGTFGQFAAGTGNAVASRGEGVLAGLSDSPIQMGGFRTNVGWFNAGASEAMLTMRAHRNNGAIIEMSTVIVPPFSQVQQHVSAIFPTLAMEENFYITYTTESPSLFVYASVVDNVNGDAILVSAQ